MAIQREKKEERNFIFLCYQELYRRTWIQKQSHFDSLCFSTRHISLYACVCKRRNQLRRTKKKGLGVQESPNSMTAAAAVMFYQNFQSNSTSPHTANLTNTKMICTWHKKTNLIPFMLKLTHAHCFDFQFTFKSEKEVWFWIDFDQFLFWYWIDFLRLFWKR